MPRCHESEKSPTLSICRSYLPINAHQPSNRYLDTLQKKTHSRVAITSSQTLTNAFLRLLLLLAWIYHVQFSCGPVRRSCRFLLSSFPGWCTQSPENAKSTSNQHGLAPVPWTVPMERSNPFRNVPTPENVPKWNDRSMEWNARLNVIG